MTQKLQKGVYSSFLKMWQNLKLQLYLWHNVWEGCISINLNHWHSSLLYKCNQRKHWAFWLKKWRQCALQYLGQGHSWRTPGELRLLRSVQKNFQKQTSLKVTSNLRSQSLKRSLAHPDSWACPADRWASECLISYCASWIGFWCESIGYGTETIEKSPFFSPFRHKKLWRSPQKGFVLPLWKLVSNSVDFLVFQKRWVKLMNLMNSPQHKRHRFGIWTFPKADGQVSKLFQAVCTQMWQSV